jgi:primosomal protein N' (replication factor Y)
MSRARVLVMNSALGPLDYRVPHGMEVEPGSIVIAPLGPRQLLGVVWEPEHMPSDAEVGDNRLRNLVGVLPVAPLAAPLRRLIEWTANYYLAPPAAVARMAMPSTSALEAARTVMEYRATGHVPDRMTPQREQALERIGVTQGLIRELAITADVSDAVIRGLVKTGALEGVEVDIDSPFPCLTPISASPRSRPINAPPPRCWSPMSRTRHSSRPCSTASPARARPKSISRPSPPRSAPASRRSSCSPRSR